MPGNRGRGHSGTSPRGCARARFCATDRPRHVPRRGEVQAIRCESQRGEASIQRAPWRPVGPGFGPRRVRWREGKCFGQAARSNCNGVAGMACGPGVNCRKQRGQRRRGGSQPLELAFWVAVVSLPWLSKGNEASLCEQIQRWALCMRWAWCPFFGLFSDGELGLVAQVLIASTHHVVRWKLSFNEVLVVLDVFGTCVQHALGFISISTGATGLLCVRLQIGRRSCVIHPAHIRLVNAHAKCACAGQHAQCSLTPLLMAFLLHLRTQSCMVGRPRNADLPHSGFPLVRLMSGLNVKKSFLVLAFHVAQDGNVPIAVGAHLKHQIGPPHGHLMKDGRHRHLGLDVLQDLRGGCGCECTPSGGWKKGMQLSNGLEVRPEVMSPLGNAMRLVHHHSPDIPVSMTGEEEGVSNSLWGHVQELGVSKPDVVQHAVSVAPDPGLRPDAA